MGKHKYTSHLEWFLKQLLKVFPKNLWWAHSITKSWKNDRLTKWS
jgi:hypothetical protein